MTDSVQIHDEADGQTSQPIDENILSVDHTKARLNSMLPELFLVVQATPPELHLEIEHDIIKLHEDKKKLQQQVKENYVLKHDLDDLDEKIRMLIKNKLSLEEVTTSVSHLLGDPQEQMATLPHEQRELYGALLYQLQQTPEHLALLTRRLTNSRDIDNFLRVVVLTLYGDQYDSHEERLLLSMFQMVLQEEFNTGELETFMRSNSAITSMLSLYARRAGSLNAVKDVLGFLLEEVVAADRMSLEINPHKVYLDMINEYESATGSLSPLPKEVTPEEAAKNPDVRRMCAERIQVILQYAERFLIAIFDNIDLMLYGVRWICRQLDKMARRKFVEASESQIFSIVGGFFFLRFINPIIVTPDGNNIIATRPNKVTRRNLTLIAKVIQNLSNGVLFGDKEDYMCPMNTFLADKREYMDNLFRHLCDVEDLEDVLSMDQYILAQSLNLTETKRIMITYNECTLCWDAHLRGVVTNTEDSVRRTLDLLGAVPEEVPRARNPTLILDLEAPTRLDDKVGFRRRFSQQHWDQKGFGASNGDAFDSPEETLRREVKLLLTQVVQAIQLMEHIPIHWGLTELLDHYKEMAVKKEDFVFAQSVKNTQSKFTELFNIVAAHSNKDKKLVHLQLEIIQELFDAHVSMFQSKEKIKRSVDRLERALDSINQQRETLLVTLDYYRQYLNNARQEVMASAPAARQTRTSKFWGSKKRNENEVKFTYRQLVDMKVIVRSDIAESAAKHVIFTFARNEEIPGRFDIVASIKGMEAYSIFVFLDDLLEEQSRHVVELNMEQLVLNLNMLIHLLNTNFVRSK